jgi:flagellar basal-body rod protein FlgF
LARGADGVFRRQGGGPSQADPGLRVAPGTLEGSNASASAAMVGMITAARRFEMHMQIIQDAQTNTDRANGILGIAN